MNIRPIALAYIEHQNKWLVEKGFDSVTETTYYRFLGGGIDFGELSADAIRRELHEEIGANHVDVHELMLVNEDIFELNGHPTHLIEFIYRVDLPTQFYDSDTLPQNENGDIQMAYWIPKDDFISKRLIFYPVAFLDHIVSLSRS